MSASMVIPVCPITLQEITDPVIDCNGHTFERVAIEEWYRNHDTSPLTNQEVANKNLVPNYALKQIIEEKRNSKIPVQPNIRQYTINCDDYKKYINLEFSIALQPLQQPLQHYIKPELNIKQYMINLNGDKKYINLEISVAPLHETSARMPLTCICVIDISGSMGERATEYNPNTENDGFSRLDLVKHSLNTIHQSLSGNDEMALITFNQNSNIVLVPTIAGNKQLITTAINALQSGGNTNIWAGLKNAIDMTSQIDTSVRNVAILVLTDGVANYDPPRGLIPTFDNYISANPNMKYTIHTFAYGYDVDSEKLSYIATKGNGIFGFIPDGTMVGTIFINAMSNILATAIPNLSIDISVNHNITYNIASKMKIYSGMHGIRNTLNIGSILYGQTYNILVQVGTPFRKGENDVMGIITNNYDSNDIIINEVVNPNIDNINNSMAINTIIFILERIIDNISNKEQLKIFLEELKSQYLQTKFILDLGTDILDDSPNRGQIGKAVERKLWYDKWGRHYLRSVLRAYELQQCLNFKDLAPQHFAGDIFKTYQSQIENIFSNITPPIPSIDIPNKSYYPNNVSNMPTPSYASIPTSYYNVSGGCFTSNWLVNMADGTTKSVRDIKPGDNVISRDTLSGTSRIKCVLKLRINNDTIITSLDGYGGITPFHPIYTDRYNEWIFPENYTNATHCINAGEYLYDFILDSGHTVNMQGGFNFVCLGHGITTSPIIQHAYFGTNRIIDDLKDHEDWTNGYITLDNWQFIRDSNNLVVKLEY